MKRLIDALLDLIAAVKRWRFTRRERKRRRMLDRLREILRRRDGQNGEGRK